MVRNFVVELREDFEFTSRECFKESGNAFAECLVHFFGFFLKAWSRLDMDLTTIFAIFLALEELLFHEQVHVLSDPAIGHAKFLGEIFCALSRVTEDFVEDFPLCRRDVGRVFFELLKMSLDGSHAGHDLFNEI